MKLYLQLKDNYITDCLEYPFSDYKEIDLPLPLPDGFISWFYKLEWEKLIYDYKKQEEAQKQLNEQVEG